MPRTAVLWNWLRRIANANHAGCHAFRMKSGGMVYLGGRATLQGFADFMHDKDTYECQVIRDAIWSDCPGLRSLVMAVKHPVDVTEGGQR